MNTVMKVRFGCATCRHPCLNVRNPYSILRARPTFAWHCFMAIIVMWFVACTIKAGQSPMLPKIRSLPFSLCNGLRIFLVLVNILCCTHNLNFTKPCVYFGIFICFRCINDVASCLDQCCPPPPFFLPATTFSNVSRQVFCFNNSRYFLFSC
jgi:hypothetical protein